jgi:3-oxoacyl-[acyl-carrier protein] reductase
MRRCVVIGGAGGIGSAICRELAGRGHHVIVADFDEARADALARKLASDGLVAAAERCDVTSYEEVTAMRVRIEQSAGPVDILVLLAGVVRNGPLLKIKDADFDLTLAIHVKGTLNGMRAFLPGMRERGYGRVVTMSSVAARGSWAGASYAAAKSAIEALTRNAALEMASRGITVNCVAPGLIDAGMFRTVPEDYQEKSLRAVPMARPGRPEEVAACVGFLASEEASYVTGQTLLICGGLGISPL